MKKILFSAFLLVICTLTSAQIYVGELSTPSGFRYMKLEAKNDSTFVSFPYEFRQTFGFNSKAEKGKEFTIKTRAEQRDFIIENRDAGKIKIESNFLGYSQSIILREQLAPYEDKELGKFTGNFIDQHGNRVIIYIRRGYLHLMSPYTEQTVSMKRVGENQFWSTSGETTSFTENSKNELETILISNRKGQQYRLKRSHGYKVIEDWVIVDGDSIYVNLFIPNISGKKPACLLLPGGGGNPQIENSEYEARLFTAHGMVTMTFEKSSVGKSKGRTFESYTFQEKALRYQQLFNYLKTNNDVNAEMVGVHGPSEGGRLALMMGINLGAEIKFINATAAPLMTSIEGQLYAADHYSRNLGMSEEDIVSTLVIWRDYYHGILNEKIDTLHFDKIRELRAKHNRAFLPPVSEVIPLSPKKEDLVDESVVTNAGSIVSPVFIQYGENDQRVDPMGSLQNFYEKISSDLDITVEIYPRGNHSMMTPEYQICTGYAYDKIKWLRMIGVVE